VPKRVFPPAEAQCSCVLVHEYPVEHGRVVSNGADEPQVTLLTGILEVVSAETVRLNSVFWSIQEYLSLLV
jgi:hypothetical protein